jgi:putative ABC transport system permease protein
MSGRSLQSRIDIQDRVAGVVISHGLWRRTLQSDPNVIGRRIEVNNLDVEIVGVLRPDFRVWLPGSVVIDQDVDVWFPTTLDVDWRNRGQATIARLAPGATLAQAQAELDTLSARLSADHADVYRDAAGPLQLRAQPLNHAIAAPVANGLLVLGAAVCFVLLIGCVNVTNLMLAKASAREREMAIRAAVGASRWRIVRQLLAEGVVLGSAGCAAGLLVGHVGIDLVSWLRPSHLPRETEISIDGTVALVAIGLSMTAALTCSLVPAIGLTRGMGQGMLSARSTVSIGGARRGLQRSLVIAEVALSIIPLVAAGLMLRTFSHLTQTPLGFDPSNVVTARVPFSARLVRDVESRLKLQRDAIAAVKALPGVEAVSAASPLPFAPLQGGMRIRRDVDTADAGFAGFAAMRQVVLPGYLSLTGTRVLRGRDITDDDIVARRDVALVDERFAEILWSGDPIGQRFRIGQRAFEVIGVTPPVRVTRVRDQPRPHFFVPYHVYPVELSLVVKTRADATAIAPAIKRAVEAIGMTRAVHDIRPLSAYVAESLNETRFAMLVLTFFATASLLLATVGLYGTLAYLVLRRSQEFGVRLALGATAGQIMRLVAAEGIALTGAGILVGAAGALAATRALTGLLYGVTPLDPVTFVVIATAVGVVALLACTVPARRAARVDPIVALRCE